MVSQGLGVWTATELSPFKEHAAEIEADNTARNETDQRQTARSARKKNAGPDIRTDQLTLPLTAEEIRLIVDYIKPAIATGTPAPAMRVGDAVDFATIPLPLQLVQKIPKLLGATFATRNGSIIILRRDSKQADAVLPSS